MTYGSDGFIPLSPQPLAKSGGELLGAATQWMPNEQSDQCMICEKTFSVFRRKHHCRSCGALVCSKCSPDKQYVHGYKDQKVRVCQRCASIREKRQRELKERGIFTSEKNLKGLDKGRSTSIIAARPSTMQDLALLSQKPVDK